MKRAWDRESLIQTLRGYWLNQVLLTAVELDIFTLLDGKRLTAQVLSEKLNFDEGATEIFLNALAAQGLLEKNEGMFCTPEDIAEYLSAKRPDTMLGYAQHLAHVSHRWHRLTETVRGETRDVPQISEWDERSMLSFIEAMHVIAREKAPRIVAALDLKGVRKVLDVGGASGTYTIAFLKASPEIIVTLFDLPPVVEMARERLSKCRLLNRVLLVPGDFYIDPLPPGHDFAWLSAITHQNSLKQNRELFKKVYEALNPDGRIVIRDYVMEENRIDPPSGALFAVNMLVNTEGGGTYTFKEFRETLEAAGFEGVHKLELCEEMDCLIEARRV